MIVTAIVLVATILSIVAALFVARGKALVANCIWSLSNIVFIWHNIAISEYSMTLLFVAYEVIAIWGIWNLWGKEYVEERYGLWLCR